MPTRFVLVKPKVDISATQYEQFIREYDYPSVLELPTIVHYRTHRIRSETTDPQRLPFDYIEQVVATDIDAYWRDLATSPRFQRVKQKKPEFQDRTLDFWADVVLPTPLAGADRRIEGVFHRWDDIPEDTARPGLPLRRLQGKVMRAVYVRLMPGVIVTPQRHPEEQLIHMLEGQLRLQVGNESRVVGPGDVVMIPPDVPHTGEAVGGPAVYIEVLAAGTR